MHMSAGSFIVLVMNREYFTRCLGFEGRLHDDMISNVYNQLAPGGMRSVLSELVVFLLCTGDVSR